MVGSHRCKWWRELLSSLGSGAIALLASTPAIAQITPDATLGGERSRLIPNVGIPGGVGVRIEGGAVRRGNLFHSFQEFNINTGQRVYFNNPADVENILTRVTGINISNIQGTLGVDGDANLFLLNPNGIVFGSNARLDVAGSFVASAGNRLVFSDGHEFSATNPQSAPLLTLNVRPGVQYGPSQGTIQNAGQLRVGAGQTLTLFGGTVTSTGLLSSSGSRVEVLGDRIALLDRAQIDVSAPGGGGTVLIGGDFQGNGSVPNATHTLIAPNVLIQANAIGAGDGGRVIVWADDRTRFYGEVQARGGDRSGNGGFVEISGKRFLDFDGRVDTRALNGAIGTLLLDPTNIEVVGFLGLGTFDLTAVDQFTDPNLAGDQTRVSATAINNATANVTLQATNNITFSSPVNIAARGVGLTAQAGNNIIVNSDIRTNSGAIQLNANDPLSGSASGVGSVSVRADIRSNGGNIVIQGASLSITDTGQIRTTSATANAGDLEINVTGAMSIDRTEGAFSAISDTFEVENSVVTTSTLEGVLGDAGDILIRAGSLSIRSATVDAIASVVFRGDAGNITIQVVDDISFVNGVISSQVFSRGRGNVGNIDIQSRTLSLIGNAEIGAVNFGTNNNLLAGEGQGGNIRINASEFVLLSERGPLGLVAGIYANSVAGTNGQAGTIRINTRNLRVSNFAQIDSSTSTQNDAGSITINAQGIEVSNFGNISSGTSGQGNGGALLIENAQQIEVSNGGSIFSGSFGEGNGGALLIENAQQIEVSNGGSISSGTFGEGNGGTLLIETERLRLQNQGIISSGSANLGNGGDLTIRASDQVEVLNGSRITTDSVSSDNFLNSQPGGNAGNLTLTTQTLVTRNSEISSSTNARDLTGRGQAGTLRINALDIDLGSSPSAFLPGGLLAVATSTGRSGDILITADNLRLQGGAAIATIGNEPTDLLAGGILQGLTGNIVINLSGTLQMNMGAIAAGSLQVGSGNIDITADGVVLRQGSLLGSSVAGGAGDAGNITIRSGSFVALDDSDILANAEAGTGGNIVINSPAFLADLFTRGEAIAVGRNPGSFSQFRGNGRVDISADSRSGPSGTVSVPNVDPGRGLTELPAIPVDGDRLIEQNVCTVGQGSEFIVTGRGGLPDSPNEPSSSEAVWEDQRLAEVEEPPQTGAIAPTHPATNDTTLVEAQNWIVDSQGKVTLVASTPASRVQAIAGLPPHCQ